jgi:acylphosphatase
MNHMRSVHLLVQGKVQGVFFRATAKDVAESLQLTGWVKNTAGGEVVMSKRSKDLSIGAKRALQGL